MVEGTETMDCPIPENEQERLAALARYGILDTSGEAPFDRLVGLACAMLQTPIAQLNFVDQERVWSKCSHGMEGGEVRRDDSFCAHAILGGSVMLVPNLLEDSRFFDNPRVAGPPRLRFYAGAPLTTADGFPLGTVCVYDTVPRHSVDAQQLAALNTIASIVVDELNQRRAAVERACNESAAGALWYREIFEACGCGLTLSNPDGNLVEANPAFCRLSGYGRNELIGRPFAMILTAEARERAARLRTGVLCGAVYPALEHIIQRKDGRRLQALILDSRVSRPDGQYCVSVFVDVSELRQAEEQIRRLQKLEAVRRLAGGVAHNINNLLTIVIGYAQIMADSLDPGDTRRRYSEEISGAAERAAVITGQLLAFSRHGVVNPRVLDINELVAGAEGQIREILGENVTYSATLRPEGGKVRAAAGQIELILKNLAQNARDAMPAGGRFTIETGAVVLDEDYALVHPNVSVGEYTLVSITDSGHGMDEETRSHLFEPYFTSKGIGKGTGLAIVYGIVRQCGGDLAIYSEPGGGTTIGLFLPKVRDAAPGSAAKPESATSGEKLLLVEDQPEVLAAIQTALEKQGYPVVAATSAEEAIRLWEKEQHAIRAAIVDVLLPRITGAELADILHARRPGLRILYMSGYDEGALSGNRLGPGALFLQKPFTPEGLRSKLRELLDPEVANSH